MTAIANAMGAITGTPAPTVTWWSEGLLLDDSFFVAPHGFSRNELKLFNVNRSNLMSELVCRASNNNLTVPVEGSVFIDLNRKLLLPLRFLHFLFCFDNSREQSRAATFYFELPFLPSNVRMSIHVLVPSLFNRPPFLFSCFLFLSLVSAFLSIRVSVRAK